MGIGIVGAGEIVRSAHLPAYQLAGFHVVGIYDIAFDKAVAIARDFSIAKVYRSLDDLLADDDVAIVDIAVPASQQLAVVEKAAAKGKHLLCQKPLAEKYDEAKQVATICQQAGIKAAVNQQMRWSPGIRATYAILQNGWLGTPVQATIQVNVKTPWDHWPWLTENPDMEFLYHSIHYMDAMRFLFGDPQSVFADAVKFPGQPWVAPTRTLVFMTWADGDTRGLIHDNHNNFAPPDDWYATFRFEGTEGIVKGTTGALYNYPIGREDTLAYFSRRIHDQSWIYPTLEGRWFPHAFMGTMGELMMAIEENREPTNSVIDNLKTLQLVFAAARAAREHRMVMLSEIDEGR